MTRPKVVFDTPQFALVADSHLRRYANVVNDIVIEDGEAKAGYDNTVHHIVVPTALFTLMKDTLKVSVHDDCFMYLLREKGSEHFIFGLAWSENEFADLWTYTETSLPPCFR